MAGAKARNEAGKNLFNYSHILSPAFYHLLAAEIRIPQELSHKMDYSLRQALLRGLNLGHSISLDNSTNHNTAQERKGGRCVSKCIVKLFHCTTDYLLRLSDTQDGT